LKTNKQKNPPARTEDVFLAPGDYLVLAHSFQRVADGRPVPGTLVVHTSKRIFTEATTANHGGQQDRDLLHQRSLVELMLKEGVVETVSGLFF
jgi:hypothetical protein